MSFFISSSSVLGLLQLGNRAVKYDAAYHPSCVFFRDFLAGTDLPRSPRKGRSQEPFPRQPNPRRQ
jgi:hypothetical protein